MHTKPVNLILICLFICGVVKPDFCPHKCECKKNNAQKGLSSDYLKIQCGNQEKISELSEIDFFNITTEIIQLNLSDNLLTSFSPKFQFKSLQKLDLSKNHIKSLTKNQFSQLQNLRKLDISQNLISEIDTHAFEGLPKLERLKLNQNRLSVLVQGTLEPLTGLKQIDLSNNPLQCNCGILWFLEWAQIASVKLLSNPKCDSPETQQGSPLRKLKPILEEQCMEHIETSMVQIEPFNRQVSFENDSLQIQCTAPVIIDNESSIITKIEWSLKDEQINNSQQFRIKDQVLGSRDLMEGTLDVRELKHNFSGNWSCFYVTPQKNLSRSVEIFIVSDKTIFCPLNTTIGNKGVYTWPLTVAGNNVTLHCESLNLSLNITEQIATHECSPNGTWINLNTSKCQFVSEQTKILQQFSKVTTNILESSMLFKNYTLDLEIFKDFIDIKFTVDTLQNYVEILPVEEVSSNLIDVVDNLLELPKNFFVETDRQLSGVCAKLLNVSEKLASATSTPTFHKNHLALEEFPVSKEGFAGMKCSWYVNQEIKTDRLFYCVTNSQAEPAGIKGKTVEASITIPETLFQQIQTNETIHKILIGVFEDNKLFPIDNPRAHIEDVTSAVIGVKLVNYIVKKLTGEPVSIMLRAPPNTAYEILPYTPVWWDPELKNWSSDGCRFDYALQDHWVFTCVNFGYYGLLQNVTQFVSASEKTYEFHISFPTIYLGSFVLLLGHFIAIVTYLFGYESIQMARKSKHSLINLWMAAFMLVYTYTFGIYQTDSVKLCQIIGLCLHYFTLSTLLWHCVSINSMYKRLSKNVPSELNDEELPSSDQPIQKPILGLYLVGWGIALIVCGIFAAINMNDYSTPSYCFLRSGPPLSALYIPFCFLSIFIFVCSLLVRCAIYSLDANGHLSEGTQATENVDLDLLEPNFNEPRSGSIRSASSMKTESEIEDPEHAPITQLKAYVISFVLYVITWILCAFATNPPFDLFENTSEYFAVSYAVVAILLSSFTVFFHCVARNDVRTLWCDFLKIMQRKKLFRTRNIADNSPVVQIQTVRAPPSLQHDITSRSSSRSSVTKSNNATAAVELNSSFDMAQTTKNNLNLIALHRHQYRLQGVPNIIENPTNAADVFYNPHQSTVARKFFRRQRKHNMMKRTNLTIRQKNDESQEQIDTAANIFGTNSKVNNTNIHVEYVDKLKKKNLNLYSEDEAIETIGRMRRKENASRPYRKKKNNNLIQVQNSDSNAESNNIMRSVSQQCTLEYYSSENLSEKMTNEPECSKQQYNNDNICERHLLESINDSSDVMEMYKNEPSAANMNVNFLRKSQMSRASSSVSASDLDELYQQIRRGPRVRYSCSQDRVKLKSSKSPCFSDSEISSYNKYAKYKYRKAPSNDNLSDNVETTV